ncbi:hypothetical protein N9X61_02020 [Sulfurimonas sp.]|nr:hypothetical protein [Sulfurimonas sp.]
MLEQADISDKELKQRWRLYWIHCIFEFSNTKLQKMAWVQGSDATWPDGEAWPSSFEGCFSAYFDDLALYDNYANALKSGNVSQEEAEKASNFGKLALFYEEPSQDPETIIQDIQWINVVAAAKEFWDYLKLTVTSQREINLMAKLEKDFS